MSRKTVIQESQSDRPIVHKGTNGCMNLAFFMTKAVKPGEIIRAVDIKFIDGSSPKKGEIIRCGSCGKNIVTLSSYGWCI